MKLSLLLAFMFILSSCAKQEDELIDSAKREARYFLTHGECASAKSALDEVDYQTDDATYISLYSDVYACRAGYGQLKTALADMTNLTATEADLFKTLASFTSAQVETAADSTAYTNIMLAIKELTTAGGTSSAAERLTKFGARQAGGLNFQALFLILIEMGKYFAFYGDADVAGVKGGGGSHNCLITYGDATALAHVTGASNIVSDSCKVGGNTSTTEMTTADPDYIRRLCEGVILYNNFQDILANLSFSSNSSELGALTDVGAILNSMETAAALVETAVTIYKDITSQSACEALANAEANNGEKLQRHFAILIENFHN